MSEKMTPEEYLLELQQRSSPLYQFPSKTVNIEKAISKGLKIIERENKLSKDERDNFFATLQSYLDF